MAPPRERPAVLVAPDSFKGSFRAAEVAAAIGRGLDSAGWPVDLCPLADGGEGTMEVLLMALGGETGAARVHDPLGREVAAGFGLVEDGGTAIVETAQASGLGLVAEEERDAVAASTAGTGELILAAVHEGAQVVLVAVGGSATTDGGSGAIAAIRDGGGLRGAQLVVLCDVRTPFESAAEVFAPQKGAGPAAVKRLTRRLRDQARGLPRDPSGVPMSGAAGGLAGGLWAALDARLESGASFVLNACGFDSRLRASRAVVTGEGSLDSQSMEGKAVGEVCVRARQAGVPAHAIVGKRSLDDFDARILDLQSIDEAGTRQAITDAGRRLGESL
ncbi:MAG: glycerate kinase [Actinomycetota bacterium]|nr:glycerate kinase [Actinomycetota bacterium]